MADFTETYDAQVFRVTRRKHSEEKILKTLLETLIDLNIDRSVSNWYEIKARCFNFLSGYEPDMSLQEAFNIFEKLLMRLTESEVTENE